MPATTLKVLHVSFSAPPDPPGGTEVYVDVLCRGLRGRGVDCVVAAPGPMDETTEADGLRVRRFAYGGGRTVDDVYGFGDRAAADAFAHVLDTEKPDIVHQHALTAACSVELARRVRQRGLPLVFTYHTPTVSCVRGTLLRWGREVCDGRLDAAACSACLLHAHGLSPAVARAVATVGRVVGGGVKAAGAEHGVWTALRIPALVAEQHRATVAFLELVDVVVAPTPWVHDLLVRLGVPNERIACSLHGTVEHVAAREGTSAVESGPLRLVHLGRLDRTKGTPLLVEAMAGCRSAEIRLDVFSVPQGGAGNRLLEAMRAHGDARIRFLPRLDHGRVVEVIAGYDALVVPSQWMETGPLVVLEAFAAGVPVIGSDLGGIAEKVRPGVDGLLVRPFDSVARWSEVLEQAASDPAAIRHLRQGVRRPRLAGQVAGDMHSIYERLVLQRPASVSRR